MEEFVRKKNYFVMKEAAASAFTVATVKLLGIIREVIEKRGYSWAAGWFSGLEREL